MDLSRKIILASCLGAAFLAFGIGCTVEDRNIEEKELFLCKSTSDCLEGSECIKANNDANTVGRCVREDQIDHCVDNDHDNFYAVTDKAYVNECGFGPNNPMDPDDTDPLVYPGAAEICDGKDNSDDGCVDGSCPVGEDCKADASKCIDIIIPCWGGGSIDTYAKSVCSADLIGANACIDGSLVYAIREGGKFVPYPETSCETDADCKYNGKCNKEKHQCVNSCPTDIPGFQDAETCGDGIDNNCNGQVDEGCVNCAETLAKLSEKQCFVTTANRSTPTDPKTTTYNTILESLCGGDVSSCPCLGEFSCDGNDIVCMKGGSAITADSVKGTTCNGDE